ncbi:MAG: tetratricopeptide repeat protein [Verrucomicrobia bacterium]|nr:tetratricopeptide repeat protein [Verrucomicrobiota bacterium]
MPAAAPSAPALHNNLGVALLRSGDLDAAIHHFQLALRLDPAHADARSNLALATAAKSRPPSAK